ncbi:hypothetical protein ACFSC4_15990 [Deinococcus malanensis]|uniref:hypothetical protein n=1 Tax=Deinococcus malanensis TaxID=1706855 RepID=UPI00362B7364
MSATTFRFDNTYARDLQGFYAPWKPASVPSPSLLFFNRELALELGLDPEVLGGPEGAAIFAGNQVPEGPNRSPRPMPGTSSAHSHLSWATGAPCC